MRVDSKGYLYSGQHKRYHITVAEQALGKPLPKGSQVHHVNEIKTDNSGSNLVICQDASYHKLLHYRTRALDATGNADSLKCGYCQQWSEPNDPEIRDLSKGSRYSHRVWHRTCANAYNLARYHRMKKEPS